MQKDITWTEFLKFIGICIVMLVGTMWLIDATVVWISYSNGALVKKTEKVSIPELFTPTIIEKIDDKWVVIKDSSTGKKYVVFEVNETN
jgi:hypothetical protein